MAKIQLWEPFLREHNSLYFKQTAIILYLSRYCEKDLWKSFLFVSGWLENPDFICNGVAWYLSNDFFYYAIFPFLALAYGKHKIAGKIICLMCISVSVGHNFWSSLDSRSYIGQTMKIYSTTPADIMASF